MKQSIVYVALLLRDYDEAIRFYTQQLGFQLAEDAYQPEQDKRWVVVEPPGSTGTALKGAVFDDFYGNRWDLLQLNVAGGNKGRNVS
jgi:catechol 2,3-dioxygenase-like lactoylglutathione lyase family enzyme